ncbi:MAG: hypothetical protein VX951_05820 [Planctomycetota bacterium]|nr:hypothetical protein [Planctomycetota bacterium]
MRVRLLSHILAALGMALGSTATPASAQGVNLEKLIDLAKTRAATQRPALQKKLAPYREVLETSYTDNWVLIDEKISEIVQLGDSIVPILLENLEPRTASPANLNLAANSARVLAKMEPAGFLQPLIDIAEGDSYAGVVHAIPLLASTQSSRAGVVLTQLLDRKKGIHQMAIIDALTRLEYRGAAMKIAKLLPLQGQENDYRATRFLGKVATKAVVPEIFRVLGVIKRGSQIMRYIRILRTCAKHDPASAERLLTFFDNQKLDRTELASLAKTLAVVAPPAHKPTITRLKAILASGDTGRLELQTAIALRALGDKTGPAALRKNLVRRTRGRSKRNYLNHANLGEYYLEFGEYKLAVDAYKAGVAVATGNAIRSMLFLQIARAQAKRERWRFVRDALKESKLPFDRIQKAAEDYPEIAEALKHETVKKFMDAFGK